VKPAVLLVGNFLSPAIGTRGICEDLAVHLVRSGWPVLTTSAQPGRCLRLWDMLRTAWRKRDQYAVAQVDVYSGPAFVWAEAVSCVLRRNGTPYVLTLHGGNLPSFARRWPGRVRRLLRDAVAVTAPSRFMLEGMKPYRADLQLLPNPLNVRAYPFRLRTRPEPRMIWLRAFHEIYNPSLAARVLALLMAEFPAAVLSMVGPDKEDGSRARLEGTSRDLGLADRLVLREAIPKDEVPRCLATADIFLNTSSVDNTPVSVLEALACGMCVISTDVGGIPYLLEHERDALLVPANNPQAMAAAVRRVLTEDGLAERLSRNGRDKAERYDWPIVVRQWEELLVAAWGSTARPGPLDNRAASSGSEPNTEN